MVTVDIRKQGGAAVITIPSAILRLLGLQIGSTLELDVKGNSLIARLSHQTKNKRYSLRELMVGATRENIQALNDQTAWALEGSPTGSELG